MSAHQTERRPLIRGRLRLERRDGHRPGDEIVRVTLGYYRTYAYVVRGPVRIGDMIEVHGRVSGWVIRPVVGFGRGMYKGPLKRGRVVR